MRAECVQVASARANPSIVFLPSSISRCLEATMMSKAGNYCEPRILHAWSVGWDYPLLFIILVILGSMFVTTTFLGPTDGRVQCLFVVFCRLFYWFIHSFSLGSTHPTHTGRLLTTNLVLLTRLRRLQHPDLLMTTSCAPYNRKCQAGLLPFQDYRTNPATGPVRF